MFIKRRKIIRQARTPELLIYSLITILFIIGLFWGLKTTEVSENNILYQSDSIKNIILSAVMKNSRTTVWICVFSLSVIGVPGILYFDYLKGYYLGVSVFSLLMSSHSNYIKSVFSILPYVVLSISALVLVSAKGIKLSCAIFKKFLGMEYKSNSSCSVTSYLTVIALSFVLEILASVSEVIININLN